MKKILITGAGGFIGGHLAADLANKGYWIRGVDIKYPEYINIKIFDDFQLLDLRHYENALLAMIGVEQVYALAADTEIFPNNSLIDINTLEAAKQSYIDKYFYASSASIYPEHLQKVINAISLKEEMAYPANPQDIDGWGKLFGEILCKHYVEQYEMEIKIARLYDIFGPQGAWGGDFEKVPAALCRKVALAKLNNYDFIEIWGDGEQTRSFCYIDDCVTGMQLIMDSDYKEPLNLGQDRAVSINELANMIMKIAGVKLEIKHIGNSQGVRGRNSDNSKSKQLLMWTPHISLEEGMKKTYDWIYEQVIKRQSNNTLTKS